jgi:hypothetical protein
LYYLPLHFDTTSAMIYAVEAEGEHA